VSKNALLALCIVALLPLLSYFLVREFSADAVVMPPRYFADTVINRVVQGKLVSDTVWHSVANISLTNQLGEQVSLDDLKGHILIVDFFFTRCPSICPTLTKHMKELQDAMRMKDHRRRLDSSLVHFISFSVDPDRDSVPALKAYADKFRVNHDSWWMLTGPQREIYDFAFQELKLGLQDGAGIDSAFIHTEKFVLLDRDRVVRGYYNGLDPESLSKLAEDITLLILERDPNRKRRILPAAN
jgi:protein SCO1/2